MHASTGGRGHCGRRAATSRDVLTTTIARSEVESALSESGVFLAGVLNVRRGETKSNSIAIAWKRDDLERLLGEATGDQIQLTFDRGTIEQAFDDVEAHGMREKVAVIAVAVAGAAALAGGASAMPMTDGGGGGGAGPVPIASGPSGAHLGDTTAVAAPAVSFAQGPSGAHLGDTTGGTAAADVPIASGPSGATSATPPGSRRRPWRSRRGRVAPIWATRSATHRPRSTPRPGQAARISATPPAAARRSSTPPTTA